MVGGKWQFAAFAKGSPDIKLPADIAGDMRIDELVTAALRGDNFWHIK
ncbi:hypothetical protein SDC9_144851 [bioreactor metagenome]|uniref:Uncharacterized protein n=1 Tax=bioreactor metagenome TaxID=1076179 RepID=A0A645E746_9ZZZZ